MKTEDIIESLNRINNDYRLKYLIKGDMIHFTVEGITDEFLTSIVGDECVISTKDWHEHFSTIEDMEYFMKCLFIGNAEIVVTYRGDKAVSHLIQILENGSSRFVSKTGTLSFSFWRPKTTKKLEYKIANKPASHRPRNRGG